MKRETEAKRIKENNKKRLKQAKRVKIKKVKKTASQKHSIQRAEEHYNLRLNRIDESKIVAKIITGDCMFVRTDIDTGRDFYYVKHNNVPIKVLYDSEFRAIVTHDRFNADEYNTLLELNNPKKGEETVPTNKIKASGQKKVKNLTTGKVYNSMKEAAKLCNTYISYVSLSCSNKSKPMGGYKWAYYTEKTPKKVETVKVLSDIAKVVDVIKTEESKPLAVKEVIEHVQNLPKLIPVSTDKKIDPPTLLSIFKAQLNATVQVINTIEENVELSKSKEKLEYELKELKNEYSNLIGENIQLNCDKNKIEIDMVKLRKMFDSLNELNIELTAEKGCIAAELHAAYEKEHLLENEIYTLKASLQGEIDKNTALENEIAELKEQLSNPPTLLNNLSKFFNR